TGRDEPARLPDHYQDHRQTEDEHAVLNRVEVCPEQALQEAKISQHLHAANHHHGGNDDAELRAKAAKNDDGQNDRGFDEGEAFGGDEALAGRKERARKTTEQRTDRKRRQLGVRRVDAERTASDLILAQSFPRPSDRQSAQAVGHDEGEDRKAENDEVEIDEAVDGGVWKTED